VPVTTSSVQNRRRGVKTDMEVRRDVEAELAFEPSIDAAKIGVAVTDGVVTLSGEVKSYAEKYTAERVAERVAGVRGVVNEIKVDLPHERTDTEIAAEATAALRANTFVPDDRVKVKVVNGWVTLKGAVAYEYERRAAEHAVRFLPGVRGVSNLITVEPPVEPRNIKQEIKKTFERQAMIDARNVIVEVQGDEVILTGTVHSWIERQEAEKAAWRAPGVRSVKNYITVSAAA
jgi:osmotically-inducible protein OsmY